MYTVHKNSVHTSRRTNSVSIINSNEVKLFENTITLTLKTKALPKRRQGVQASLNMMARAKKPDFVFRRNERVHLNWRGRQFIRLLATRGVRISGSNAGYTILRGSVNGSGYPFHSPVSPSLPRSCVTVCHHISNGV
jgi:hypothetical protein